MTSIISERLGHLASIELSADVLVIGGGPAGTWAALAAAAEGLEVVLADKGYCGTSGATAPSGVGVWYVAPDPEAREEARSSREATGGYLSDRRWMDRVLDTTYANVDRLALWGHPFPKDEQGGDARRSLQGPEYTRLMRKRVKAAGVRVLDHSPALELLVDEHCQTCFMCELYCPADALFVAPEADEASAQREDDLRERGLLGGYRAVVGWGSGQAPGAARDQFLPAAPARRPQATRDATWIYNSKVSAPSSPAAAAVSARRSLASSRSKAPTW